MPKSETSSGDSSRPWQSYHTVYTTAKAGMDGVDKEKVQRTVYEMSKGSKYFENEERKEALMQQKIEHMHAQCARVSSADISHFQKIADKRIAELEDTRDLSRTWLHVDMDAFYAAVETLSNPSLKGKPMAVGSMSMISTANYEARKYGVRSAMPGFIARKLCPKLIFVPVDFEKYNHYSSLTRKVFQRYDPNFIAASLDEAYLDITEACKERGLTGEEVAEQLRKNVFEETGLTCSAGVAANRLLAKVCSDINKPNGQFILPNDREAIMTFISSLPIRKIGGIGKVTEHILRDVFGINTCEDMLQKSSFICALFSHSSADFFLSVGLGLGKTDTPEARLRKSMSNERTFAATKDEKVLYQKLELADTLSADLQKEGLRGRTLTLKLKTASFEIRTRAVTVTNFICEREEILMQASKLLKAELPLSVRLIGLRVSQFSEDCQGLSDPKQRSITNFIVSGEAAQNRVNDGVGRDLPSDSKDCLVDTASNPDLFDDRDSKDVLDTFQVSESCHDKCGFNDNSLGAKRNNASIGRNPEELDDSSEVSCSSKLSNVQQLAEANGFPFGSEVVNRSLIPQDINAASSSNQQEHVLWVDGFKCSICGFELPPDFVEERQEHSDFHHAQELQKKFSGANSLSPKLKQRHVEKDEIPSQSRKGKKKPKLSSSPRQGKYIPIDTFFR